MGSVVSRWVRWCTWDSGGQEEKLVQARHKSLATNRTKNSRTLRGIQRQISATDWNYKSEDFRRSCEETDSPTLTTKYSSWRRRAREKAKSPGNAEAQGLGEATGPPSLFAGPTGILAAALLQHGRIRPSGSPNPRAFVRSYPARGSATPSLRVAGKATGP